MVCLYAALEYLFIAMYFRDDQLYDQLQGKLEKFEEIQEQKQKARDSKRRAGGLSAEALAGLNAEAEADSEGLEGAAALDKLMNLKLDDEKIEELDIIEKTMAVKLDHFSRWFIGLSTLAVNCAAVIYITVWN